MSDSWTPPPGPAEPSGHGRALAAVGAALVALIVVVGAVVVFGSGDDGGTELARDADEMGDKVDTRGRDELRTDAPRDERPVDEPPPSAPPITEAPTTTEPEDNCATAGEILDRDALPPPDITAEPLELQIERAGRGTEFPFSFDGSDNWPYVGELFVEVTPGTYTDVPVHLEAGRQAVIFAANDCIKGSVEIYSPSGERIGVADDLGRPGVVEGWEFTDADEITEAGTYVFRVIQDTGTDDGGFSLRFYAPED